MEPDNINKSYPNRGRGRQLFIKGVSLLGLALYVPAFLVVLLAPGLIATGAKKMLVHEVNQRFEKIGGLATTITNKTAGLKAKFEILEEDHARFEEEMLEKASAITKNADRIISYFIDERTKQVSSSGNISNLDQGELENDLAGDPGKESDTNAIADDDKTSRSWVGNIKDKVTSRLKTTAVEDKLTTAVGISAVFVSAIYGPGGLFENMIKRPGVELERLKNAIYEKYDITLRELVRELRIFTGSNVVIFAILWFAGGSARRARKLFPLAILLLCITLLVSYAHVFLTNWIYTVLHRSYMGWGFLGVVLFLFVYVGHDVMLMNLLDSDDESDKRAG